VNLTIGSLLDFTGLGLGFLFTILIFSYLLGDNPFFRLAIHIFIGVSAAYVALVTINNVLIPRLIIPLINGTKGERLLSLLLFIPSLFLLTKATPLRKAGNWSVAILVGIGGAAAVGGAITGTLFPQILGTIPSLHKRSTTFSSLMPPIEPIIGSGRILTQDPTRSQSLAIILDGIQPTGVTTLALDQNGLLPGLGAASDINPLLTVQVIESNTFLNLGTIIAPIGYARPGTPILRIQVNREDGRNFTREIKFGALTALPIELGEKVSLHLRPLHRFDVGMGGPGKSGKVNAVGGSLGIIIDARGRPLHFFQDQEKNWKRNETWIKTLLKYE